VYRGAAGDARYDARGRATTKLARLAQEKLDADVAWKVACKELNAEHVALAAYEEDKK
jgi:hypothetical protein